MSIDSRLSRYEYTGSLHRELETVGRYPITIAQIKKIKTGIKKIRVQFSDGTIYDWNSVGKKVGDVIIKQIELIQETKNKETNVDISDGF